MANPTFNSTALFTKCTKENVRSPDSRDYIETMPGADGEFVQPHGTGGRFIYVQGVLEGTGESAAAANVAYKLALRTAQALIGSAVATYKGNDGVSYTNCSLLRYEQMGAAVSGPLAGTYATTAHCMAVLRQHTP